MAFSADIPITRKCKQCGRRFPLEHMHQVETRWRAGRYAQWQVLCDGCAKAYSDFMAHMAAEGNTVPSVVIHGI